MDMPSSELKTQGTLQWERLMGTYAFKRLLETVRLSQNKAIAVPLLGSLLNFNIKSALVILARLKRFASTSAFWNSGTR